MLTEIGDKKQIPEFIQGVKARERLLMGFGHRVYKSYDPRAKIIKQTADQVFEVTDRNPLLDIALELERNPPTVLRLVELTPTESTSQATIDEACKGRLNHAMGPLATADLVGLDTPGSFDYASKEV